MIFNIFFTCFLGFLLCHLNLGIASVLLLPELSVFNYMYLHLVHCTQWGFFVFLFFYFVKFSSRHCFEQRNCICGIQVVFVWITSKVKKPTWCVSEFFNPLGIIVKHDKLKQLFFYRSLRNHANFIYITALSVLGGNTGFSPSFLKTGGSHNKIKQSRTENASCSSFKS